MMTCGHIYLPLPLTELLDLVFLFKYFIIDYFLLNKINKFLQNNNLNLTEISYIKIKSLHH